MYAIGIQKAGGPEVLEIVELPPPEPAAGQVRIKTRAAGINPVDVMVRDGLLDEAFKDLPRPYVPGMDASGVIDEVGDGVDSSWLHKEVVTVVDNAGDYGAYSEYVCVPVESVASKPEGKSFEEAASFLMNALTARNALDNLSLPEGASVLVTGAAGGVGEYAVALACQDGLTAIAQASASDEESLTRNGAAHFVSRDSDLTDAMRSAFPNGVDAVIDAAGIFEEALPALKDGGTIIVLRPRDEEDLPRGITSKFVNVRDRIKDTDVIESLVQKVADGKLATRVAATFRPQEAKAAHEKMAQKGLRGRVVFLFE